MRRIILAAGLATAPVAAEAQVYRPDFSCSVDHSKDSIATMLCQNSEAAKHELIFDQTYYALRQVVGKNGWKSLKQEAISDDDAFKQCIAVASPENSQELPLADPGCYVSHIDALTEKYKRRLSGSALQEASRPIDDHIALQGRLIVLGFLPSSAAVDGVYGEATRQAIQTWQRVAKRPQADGFISDSDASILLANDASTSPAGAGEYSAVNPIGSEKKVAPAQVVAVPDQTQEDSLISIVAMGRQEYENGQNDFQKGAARPRRASRICSLIKDPNISNWSGVVEELSSNSSGYGVLKIRISPHITIGTTNNSFSDSIGSQKTLIYPSDPVFSQVSNLSVGQKIVFSGIFSMSNDDCIAETSITQSGSMEDPDFEMKFTEVRPAE